MVKEREPEHGLQPMQVSQEVQVCHMSLASLTSLSLSNYLCRNYANCTPAFISWRLNTHENLLACTKILYKTFKPVKQKHFGPQLFHLKTSFSIMSCTDDLHTHSL